MADVPSWWEWLLLSLAAWRSYRLLAEDSILERPRRWVVNLDQDWEEPDRPNQGYRARLAEFISCPYCFGAWITILWWAAWLIWPHATTLIAVPFAINTIVIGVAKLDR